MIFTYLIVKRISNKILVICGFLLLNTNPYLLDFFSIARGYGMAVSLMTISIYFLILFKETEKKNKLILSIFFACFALLSNFSLLIYLASLLIIINLIWITSDKEKITIKSLIKKNIPIGIILIILFVILYEPIRKLIKFDCLYSGGEVGFWSDTVGSLIDTSLYGQSYFFYAKIILRIFVVLAIFTMSIIIILKTIRAKRFSINNFILFFLLLLLPCFISICQHYIIGSKFLINRMAIFFIPLFFLAIIYFIGQYFNTKKLLQAKHYLVIVLALLLSIHTVLSANTTSFLSWRFEAQTKEMLNDLQTLKNNEHKTKINLGISWLYEATINYYIKAKKYTWLTKVENEGPKQGNYDYYYIMKEDKKFIEKYSKKIIKEYTISGSLLIK